MNTAAVFDRNEGHLESELCGKKKHHQWSQQGYTALLPRLKPKKCSLLWRGWCVVAAWLTRAQSDRNRACTVNSKPRQQCIDTCKI
jgi:hypothetical protein